MNRGYFGIGIYQPKVPANVGTLCLSAYNFGAAFVFTIGHRQQKQATDTVKATRHVPLFAYRALDDFWTHRPDNVRVIGIENHPEARALYGFPHPERAVYLLGAEGGGVPPPLLELCDSVIAIESPMCLNVSVAGSILMYDRRAKAS
jgi:tRNA G18 (ribose-2'-O)-methylase SpoU